MVNLGFPINTIGTVPFSDNALFVDEKTLEPVFNNNNNNLSIKKIKSLVQTFKK